MSTPITTSSQCPLPLFDSERVTLAHGGGGRAMHRLLEQVILPIFDQQAKSSHDGYVFDWKEGQVAFTTDSYVVTPLFFPGGDIGQLAINGTVNDLAMCGAKPLVLSVSFVIEEGLALSTLTRICHSLKAAADLAEVKLATGDTKVIERNKGDQFYINTSGIGRVGAGIRLHPDQIRAGDLVLVNGYIAEHGIAVLSAREGLQFEYPAVSDCAPLHELVRLMLEADPQIHCLRDPTRGGLTSALNEIAQAAALGIIIRQSALPIHEYIMGACEMLGLDPMSIANEGKLLAFVSPATVAAVLKAMQSHPLGIDARVIGEVVKEPRGKVLLTTPYGTERVLEMFNGEQLPRIC